MDMLEFERNRRKKKENQPVNNINVNSSIDKKQFINYNPLNDFKINQEESVDTKVEYGSTTNGESPFKFESTTNHESTTKKERALDNGTPSKMKAPKNISFNLNSIERARVSLDSLRIEQIVKEVSNATQTKEVVIGRKVFEQNGVNKARFVQSREETRDRGVIDFEIRKGKNGEETWYWLK